MSIPGAMMPGESAGGMMGGMMNAGGPMPAPPPPGPGPGGPGQDVMKLLSSMQEAPSPAAGGQMLHQASMLSNGAYARITLRSAKASKFLSMANSNISSAREALNEEGSRPMAPAPNLGTPETAGMNPGAMSGL